MLYNYFGRNLDGGYLNMYSYRKIKKKFLDFFVKNGHLEIDGSSVIPKNDPTLLYINAGMASIKNYFTGDEIPPKRELCDVQSCIRTIDIDDIGDRYHLTSFQMLGSWSIGSYFKERAIELAYDFLVNVLRVPLEKLYVSVFEGNPDLNLPFDEESKNHWIRVGVPKDHIVSFGMEDNFWGPASETGPCGPCTEVFYDTGFGPEYVEGGVFDTSRYIEIWNAGVFMMFNKNSEGSFSNLAFNSVDTGAGLERLTMTLNGLKSVYDIDLLLPICNFIKSRFGFEDDMRSVRILTDHLRTSSLILSEGQEISNEGRGYIPRKLIRKCISILKKNEKHTGADISEIVEFIADMDENLKKNKEKIISSFNQEKDKFEGIFKSGFEKLKVISKNGTISSGDAFDLVTSFGFPFEFIKEYACENSIRINEEEFLNLMKKHKEISRADSSGAEKTSFSIPKNFSNIATKFVGYSCLSCSCNVLGIFNENFNELENSEGFDSVFFISDCTPIYARGGGQESDKGTVSSNDFSASIEYAIKKNDVIVHFCKVRNGVLQKGNIYSIKVDEDLRNSYSRAHSCTHLLQSSLRKIFGSEVHQKGSKVDSDFLRFDFNFQDKITREKVCEIEKIVNFHICENLPSDIIEMKFKDASDRGFTAIFSEKYGEIVRAVSFGEFSKELCGGTHVKRTGDIGYFVIESCESIGKGIKRISAYTSLKAVEYTQNILNCAFEASDIMHIKVSDLPKSVSNFSASKKESVLKKIDKSSLIFLNTKIPFAYCICEDNFSNGVVTDTSEDISGIFVMISSGKNRVSLSVCKKLDMNAKDLLLKFLSKVGGKGGGNNRISSGGFSVNSDELVKFLKETYEGKI